MAKHRSPIRAADIAKIRAEHQQRLRTNNAAPSTAVTDTTPSDQSDKADKMSENKQEEKKDNVTVVSSQQKMVELGRVVRFTEGKYEHHIAVIVEIIDHKRALVDGPSTTLPKVPRHAASLYHVQLTDIVMKKLPRGIRTGKLQKKWDAAKVEEQYMGTSAYKQHKKREARENMTDYDRFVCRQLLKERRKAELQALAKIKAEDKAKEGKA